MLTHIPANSLQSLRQLAVKMEQILLVALDQYGNTFVEPKVELGARFGHLVRESPDRPMATDVRARLTAAVRRQCASWTSTR